MDQRPTCKMRNYETCRNNTEENLDNFGFDDKFLATTKT